MSNVEEYVEAKKMGRDYLTEGQPAIELSLEMDGYAAFLLAGLAQQFADPPRTVATELLRAALLDAWEAAGNQLLAEDEITEHYGEEMRKAFDESG